MAIIPHFHSFKVHPANLRAYDLSSLVYLCLSITF